ncbi:MAG TPA: DUF4157 domain-containing protein, partial [Puia sp.]|nr:DUF4157 domain-containing protein [Puia sp.]
VQRKTNSTASTAPSSVENSLSSGRGKGNPLPENIQHSMGSAMGADLSGVRIHQDQSAADMSSALEAQAFTHGRDIYFNQGKYNPSSKDGQHLLAHELTHTVQQGASAQRKLIQRAPDPKPNPTANTGSPPPYPSFDQAGKKLYIEKINLPDFKKRNSEKFIVPLHALQPRPAVRSHNDIWKEFVQGAVYAKTASFLQDKQKTTDGIYFLKAKNSDFRIIGKMEQVQEEALFPKWNRFGKGNLHQVDHIVELQLGGSNAETNYELTDKLANTSSGNSIKLERQSRMDEARTALLPNNPNLPARTTLNTEYITHYSKVESWNLPYRGNGDVYWTMSEIKDGAHFQQLRQMTANEISDSQGSDKVFVLYIRESSGLPMKIKLPFKKPQNNWLPGIDLTDFNFTPGTADNQEFGEIKVTLGRNFTQRMKAGRDFSIKFNKKAFLINTGYLVFKDKDKGLEGILEFNGLSPIVINEFSLHETAGIMLEGNIMTNIPIIDKTPIAISMIGDDFTVSKELSLDDLKDKFPKPFVVNDLSLTIFASTKKGLGVQGLLDFEVAKIGKGLLKGLGSTQDGFGIEGKFQFDPELFKSEINVSYIKNEFKFAGSVTLEKEKIPGVKSLTVKVNYDKGKVTGDGKATLNIPGVKEFGIHIEQLENGGLLISGDVDFGSKLKSAGKVQASFEKGDAGWDVSIKGQMDPNINIGGLSIREVKASFVKGVFDVSAKVHFGQGKISGDFDLGVTNGTVDETGKKSEAIGKELIYYASGQVGLVITPGVEAKLKVRITKDGDILIGGEMNVTEDKNIVPGKKGDKTTDKALNIWDFAQKIPIASCGVVSLVLELDAGIGLFYEFKGLNLDKGTKVTLEEISLKNLSKAKITSDISLSTGVKAGVDAYIGAKAGLQVLIAGVRGTGRVNLKLTAFDANAKAKVEAGFSADEGLKFKTAEMKFDVESMIGYDVEVGVEVYLDLLVSDITLWEHKWKPDDLKGEYRFNWFDGTLTVPLKFGENNSLSTEDVSGGLKKEIGNHSKDQKTYMDGVKQGVDGKGPDPQEVEQQMTDKIKSDIGLAYRGAHSKEVFAFNASINEDYFQKRIGAWDKVGRLKSIKPEIKELLKGEIRRYEREEFDAFSIFLKGATNFDAGSKFLLIDDFMRFRPSLTLEDKASLESLIPADQRPKKSAAPK